MLVRIKNVSFSITSLKNERLHQNFFPSWPFGIILFINIFIRFAIDVFLMHFVFFIYF